MEILKRVLVTDGGYDHHLMLTEDQIRLLQFMIKQELCYGEVTYSVLDDQEWETV